jgi:glutathione S-transferase
MFFKDSPFFVQGHSLTLADIMLGTWLEQLQLIQIELSEYPNITTFQEHLRVHNAAFQQAHKAFNEQLSSIAQQNAATST